jgi:hypothetical protein
MNFYKEIQKILEDFNIYPRSKAIQGRQAPVPSMNVNSTGPIPVGFKGAGPTGIAPSATSTVFLQVPKKKKKKKIKKKKDFFS